MCVLFSFFPLNWQLLYPATSKLKMLNKVTISLEQTYFYCHDCICGTKYHITILIKVNEVDLRVSGLSHT